MMTIVEAGMLPSNTASENGAFLLGWIADQFALKQAFGLVILLLIALTGLLLFAHHLRKRMLEGGC
ncbi:MAG: hypothetical protein VKL39_20310 [Leptolyngbyaceae bacterium]|nr:hypothetical protein [Leptolyngbyaceae bacterium]